MKHLLIIILALILPMTLVGQTKSQVISDITNTMDDFASDLSFVNENQEYAAENIQSISRTFGSADYFIFNNRQMSSFQEWMEEYCFQVMNKEYASHTFQIIQQTVEKVDIKEKVDNRYSFKAIMKRELSDATEDEKTISFIVEWKGKGQYVSILEIKGDFNRPPVWPGLRKTPERTVIHNCQLKVYEYVDLGLSVKWATCNLGASMPEDTGEKYGWGELTAAKVVNKKNSRTYNEKEPQQISGLVQYDAARAKLKGKWRMPTSEELRELQNKCKWEVTTLDGSVYVIKATGPNGNSIFFPIRGRYWSGNSIDKKHASYLSINKPITFNNNPISNHTRITMMLSTGAVKYATLNIRPVIE